jgi:hypothetical protein
LSQIPQQICRRGITAASQAFFEQDSCRGCNKDIEKLIEHGGLKATVKFSMVPGKTVIDSGLLRYRQPNKASRTALGAANSGENPRTRSAFAMLAHGE